MKTMNRNTYGKPAIGCYLDHANYNNDELSRKIIQLAYSLGWEADEEVNALCERFDLGCDDERSDGPDMDVSEQLDEASEEAIDWLNEQETRPFMYWANKGEANAFGLWANLESAQEDCGFMSSGAQEYPADDFNGEWLHVNDHGNCTLYVRTNGNDVEIWSLV